jgi:hypothetical protein
MNLKKFATLIEIAYENLKQQGKLVLNRTTLKELWKQVHAIEPKLRLADFKKLLWELHKGNFLRYQLERCPLIMPHTKRYGIETERGIYAYFKLEDKSNEVLIKATKH